MPLTAIKRDILFVVLASIAVTSFVMFAGGWGFPLDDSWIHQTYGRNLAQYGEWAFLPGEPSAASTSPLYTVVLAIGYLLNIPYMFWAHFVGTSALVVAAMLGARLAEMALPQAKNVGLWAGLALIGTWHLVWASSSGMETMVFGMFTLWMVWLAWRELDAERSDAVQALLLRGGLLGVMTALTTLARPEGVMLGGIIAILMLIVRPQGSLKNVIIYGIGSAIGFFIFMSPYLWVNWQITGGVLPNTANAKFEQHAILLQLPYFERYTRLLIPILAGGQLLLIPGAIAYGWHKLRDEKLLRGIYYLLPLIWSVSHIALYAARLPASYQYGRYVMPALPTFVVAGIIGTVWLHQSRPNPRNKSLGALLHRVSVQVLAWAIILLMLIFFPRGLQTYSTDIAVINSEMVASAYYIRDNIPEDELMAIHDIGAVGYFAPRPMIDIAGLVTPEIIPIVTDGDALWAYMEANGAEYLMAFPDQIPNDDPTDPRLCLIFSTESEITMRFFGEGNNMAIYSLAYDATCDD